MCRGGGPGPLEPSDARHGFARHIHSDRRASRFDARHGREHPADCRPSVPAWLDVGIERNVAVNVSPAQFENANLVPEIIAILREFDVDPGLLELEITESMLMSDFAATRERIIQLQEAGIKISIDDFGTGFSNLSQLAKLSFNAIKIDQSLIADIGKNNKSENIVKAIVDMTHALGNKTVAEGIEKPEQLHFLQRIGCETLQGFLFARPMPAVELETWQNERSQNAVTQMHEKISSTLSKR